jgi:hypothetical protein
MCVCVCVCVCVCACVCVCVRVRACVCWVGLGWGWGGAGVEDTTDGSLWTQALAWTTLADGRLHQNNVATVATIDGCM